MTMKALRKSISAYELLMFIKVTSKVTSKLVSVCGEIKLIAMSR
jgi:hypothetical protein